MIEKRTAARVAGLVKKHGSAAAALVSAEAMLLPAPGFALLAQQMAEDIARHEAYTQQRIAALEARLERMERATPTRLP